MNRIYFDNASTTEIDKEVLEAMMPYLSGSYGNASSIHSFGKTSKVLLEDARDTVAAFMGAKPKEIFFTSGGTESNNFALKGISFHHFGSGKNHIITSSIEHLAVLDTLGYLSEKFKFNVTYLKPDSVGIIHPESISSAIQADTFLISIMHSNNETGVINDLQKISQLAHDKNIFLHSDTVQSIGKTKFNVRDIDVDMATMSAHKIYGPKGIGALYIRDKTPVDKFIHGGKQEREMRGGTENIASIAGFKKAIELLKERFENDVAHYGKLKERLIQLLEEKFDGGIIFNSPEKNSLPNIVNISFDKEKFKCDEETILIQLDLNEIAVSGGSACTSGSHKPSHVLLALGRDLKTALGSIRISFGRKNTFEEIDFFVNALTKIVKRKS